MPVRMQGFVDNDHAESVFLELISKANENCNYVKASSDGQYLSFVHNIIDAISGKPVMRAVITAHVNNEENTLEIVDTDLVLIDSVQCSLTDAWRFDTISTRVYECYQVVCNGRQLEVETVNRHIIDETVLPEGINAQLSLFPFSFELFDDEDSFRHRYDLGETKGIPGLEDGYRLTISPDFTACSDMFRAGSDETERFSVIGAEILEKQKVVLEIGKQNVEAYILTLSLHDLEGIKAILPADDKTTVLLKNARCIMMKTDVKADFSTGENDYYIDDLKTRQTDETAAKDQLMWCSAFYNRLKDENGDLDEDLVMATYMIAAEQAVPYYETDEFKYFNYKFKDTVAELLLKCKKTEDNGLELKTEQTIIRNTVPMIRTLLHGNKETGTCVLSGESGFMVVSMDPMGFEDGEEIMVHPYIYAEKMDWYPDRDAYDETEFGITENADSQNIILDVGMLLPVSSMMMGSSKNMSEDQLKALQENQTYSIVTGSLIGYERDELIMELKREGVPEEENNLHTGIFDTFEFITNYGNMTAIVEPEVLHDFFDRNPNVNVKLNKKNVVKFSGNVGAFIDIEATEQYRKEKKAQ